MLSGKLTGWNAAMSDTTPLKQIRDHLQAVLDIMAAEYPFQLDNNEMIPVLIRGVWGEIIDDTKPKNVTVQTWCKNIPKTPSVDHLLLNEAYCENQ